MLACPKSTAVAIRAATGMKHSRYADAAIPPEAMLNAGRKYGAGAVEAFAGCQPPAETQVPLTG